MYSPEVQVEPFMDSQSGSPPVSPTVDQREGYFPSAEPSAPSPWQRRSSVSTSDQPRPVFESLTRSPPLKEGQISSPPPHSYPLPPSPTQTTTKPLGAGAAAAARRLSRASAKSIDRQSFVPPTSPPTLQQPIPTSPVRPQLLTLPPQETSMTLPPGSRNLPPRTPPHAALASPPLSSTLSSSRRTSGSSITPPSSSSSLASIPGLGPAHFSGGLTPDLSNPYRSQMERPLDTVKRLSRQVERRDYSRGAPSAGGPSSYRTEDMFASSEMSNNKSSHSPTPSTHSAPPFVMTGAYPSAMNGAYPSLSMNGAYPSALAMSGPYPTRGSHLSSFENPWPTWEGPSPATIDAKLASKKARRMSSAPNNQEGDRRKQSQSEHGSSATRTKSHGKEREHLSPNGSPILGGGNTYSPSPLSQASSPVATPAGTPGLSSPPPPPVPTVTLDRSGSKKKKRLSMWGRSKPEDEPPLPTTPTKKDLLAAEDARSRTVSAPAKSTSSASIPPVPTVPATISSPRSTSNSRSKPNSPSRAPPLAPIVTSELTAPPNNSSSPSSSTTTTTTTTTPQQPSSHHHNGGLLSHFGSHKGGRKASAPKSAPPSPKKLAAPPGPPPPSPSVVTPVLSSKSRKVSRDMALREEAKEEKGLGGLWKRLSMSKKGKGTERAAAAAAATEEKDASRMASKSKSNGSNLGQRAQQHPLKLPHVADVVVAPGRGPPSAPPPAPPPPPPATPERNHPDHVVPTPSSSGSSSSTTTARAPRPSRPQDPRVSPSPPSLGPAAVGSHQQNISRSRSPTRPPPNEPLPPTPAPPAFYGSTEVGASPSPPKPLRSLPSPPRGNQSNHSLPNPNHHQDHSSAEPIPHSSTFPNIRQLPHFPPTTTLSTQPQPSTSSLPPNFSRRGASYDPPSSSSPSHHHQEGHDYYTEFLARSVSHPSRPPTPPSKESFVGHELAQTSSSSAGSEGSRGGVPMWEPRTAGSSFTVYTAAGEEEGEGVKV